MDWRPDLLPPRTTAAYIPFALQRAVSRALRDSRELHVPREAEGEHRPALWRAGHRQLAAHGSGQLPRDVDPEPRARLHALPIESLEPFEDPLVIGLGNTRTLVGHVNGDSGRFFVDLNAHGTARSVFQGIANEVVHDLLDGELVADGHDRT